MRGECRLVAAATVSLIACSTALDASDGDDACALPVARRVAAPPNQRDPAPVVIRFRRGVDLPALGAAGRTGRAHLIEALVADSTRAQRRTRALLQTHGIDAGRVLWLINGLAATVPRPLLDEIARLPEVERIDANIVLRAPVTTRGIAAAPAWNLAALRAPELWATGQRGSGAVVAILDTGVDAAHPDLAPAWRASGGWFDPYGQHAAPYDSDGHGTLVAGLVVGGDVSGVPIGVAPDARWIASRIYDDTGAASLAAIHAALQWVLDPDGDPSTDDAADVVVAAWGYSELVAECFLELEPDLAALRVAQVAPVFSAGNTGPYGDSSISPANNPSAVAAGAIDETYAVSSTSARGPGACTGAVFPALVAPGVNVRTTDLTFGGQTLDSYSVVTGTSFAAPQVAGALAVLRGAHPNASMGQLEDALRTTAFDLAPAGPDDASGFGLVDLMAADARLSGRVAGCTDRDGDGYIGGAACDGAVDCSDTDATIHPGACDPVGDGRDQDCDGRD